MTAAAGESRPGCPHPEKVAHRTKKAAEKGMATFEAGQGVDLTLRAYFCECGTWHLGHKGKNKSQYWQIQKALKAGKRNAFSSRRQRRR